MRRYFVQLSLETTFPLLIKMPTMSIESVRAVELSSSICCGHNKRFSGWAVNFQCLATFATDRSSDRKYQWICCKIVKFWRLINYISWSKTKNNGQMFFIFLLVFDITFSNAIYDIAFMWCILFGKFNLCLYAKLIEMLKSQNEQFYF